MPKGIYVRKPSISKDERAAQKKAYYHNVYKLRPEARERARIRNQKRRAKRAAYKKTEAGRAAEKRYRTTNVKHRTYQHEYRLKKLYGITEAGYQRLYQRQGGCCAICREEVAGRLHIDHCHKTGLVRGLLCGNCNRALGLMKDEPSRLLEAVKYLER